MEDPHKDIVHIKTKMRMKCPKSGYSPASLRGYSNYIRRNQ